MSEKLSGSENMQEETYADMSKKMRMHTVNHRIKLLKDENPENGEGAVEKAKNDQKNELSQTLHFFVDKLRNDPKAIEAWGVDGVINFLFGRNCTADDSYRGWHGNSTDLLTPEEEISIAEQVVQATGLTLDEAQKIEEKWIVINRENIANAYKEMDEKRLEQKE